MGLRFLGKNVVNKIKIDKEYEKIWNYRREFMD